MMSDKEAIRGIYVSDPRNSLKHPFQQRLPVNCTALSYTSALCSYSFRTRTRVTCATNSCQPRVPILRVHCINNVPSNAKVPTICSNCSRRLVHVRMTNTSLTQGMQTRGC
jgi:hypothetical protein